MVLEDLMMNENSVCIFLFMLWDFFKNSQQLARNIAEVISAQANIERVMGLLEQVTAGQWTAQKLKRNMGTYFSRKKKTGKNCAEILNLKTYLSDILMEMKMC